jgi:anti-sigma regulatory factor (Ser/Thr protein kinase)
LAAAASGNLNDMPTTCAHRSGAMEELAFGIDELQELRRFVAARADEELLDGQAAADLVLAVSELASNSIRHGGGVGTLRVWREPQALVCEVEDEGHIADPLVGRRPPGLEARCGRGLWLVRQLCDLLEIRSGVTGTVVRVHKRIA